jgi:hypothetical protein
MPLSPEGPLPVMNCGIDLGWPLKLRPKINTSGKALRKARARSGRVSDNADRRGR